MITCQLSISVKIVVAIDSFKGCLTSMEANAAARSGILAACADAEVVDIPVSDGGEGWLDAYRTAVGGEMVSVRVCDPLMRQTDCCYLRKGDLAVIETARAIGLTLLKAEERNPLTATSYGVGQLVTDAIRRGCRRFVIGLGGSGTSDAGKGMLQALSDAFGSEDLYHVSALKDLQFTLATDVTNPLCGPQGAAHVFGPQKGATPEMVVELDRRAAAFAEQSAKRCGHDCSLAAGAGAAGGLGYAFMQYLRAGCRSGIDLLLDAVGFDKQVEGANLVVTGEGRADGQTLMGKLPHGIMLRASRHHVPTLLIAGKVTDRQMLLDAGFAYVESINPPTLPLEEAMEKAVAAENIRKLMERFFRLRS